MLGWVIDIIFGVEIVESGLDFVEGNDILWDKTVVRRFVAERAIDVQWKSMSNGFDVIKPLDIDFHWTSIAVHLQIVAQLI